MTSISIKITPVIPARFSNHPCFPRVVKRYSQTANVALLSFIPGVSTNNDKNQYKCLVYQFMGYNFHHCNSFYIFRSFHVFQLLI